MSSGLPTPEEWRDGAGAWPHAPPHRLEEAGVYFVTARCFEQRPHFQADERRDFLLERLHSLAARYDWTLEAWAVLSNHYHFVANSPISAGLSTFLGHLHSDTARWVNRADGVAGRKVWQNYRETHLTYQHSYLARLNYTHQNPVHHRLVPIASHYHWCSAGDFERAVTPAWFKTVLRFQFEQIATEDGE